MPSCGEGMMIVAPYWTSEPHTHSSIDANVALLAEEVGHASYVM